MGLQTTVNVLLNLGVPGDILLDEPHRSQPCALDGNGGNLSCAFTKNALTGIATQGGVAGQGTSAFTATTASGSPTITVTAISAGAIQIGQTVTGAGIPGGTTIIGYGTGSGGLGTYTMSANATASASVSVAGAGGSPAVFAGIAANSKIEPLFGSSATNPLAASEVLEPNAQVAMLTFGSMVVNIPNNFNIGDPVVYNVNTGVLGSVAPGAAAGNTNAFVPNCQVYGVPGSAGGMAGNNSGGGLAIIRLTTPV